MPAAADLPDRLNAVLAVLYLIFTEGHTASSGTDLTRPDLASEAIRLTRVLAALLPGEPEVLGLLALQLLTESRRAARLDADGIPVLLPDQDRDRWNWTLIAEGQDLVRQCLRLDRPGPYQIQAAINAVHSDGTDWVQILALYDQLLALTPTPIVALNRAVALAEVEGPAVALTIVDSLDLGNRHLFHAVRADLLARLGRTAEAVKSYDEALRLVANKAERLLLQRKRTALNPATRD